jgi:pSer/pThr/pTyr-binding forkhead associated (FHA) protein
MPIQPKLTIVGGKASKGVVTLKLPAQIGRHRDAALKIAHRTVSRKHCELFEVDGLLMVRDLGSLNGTYVKGRRVNDIGPLTFRVSYGYAGDHTTIPPIVFQDDEESLEFEEVSNVEEAPESKEAPEPKKEPESEELPELEIEEEVEFEPIDEPADEKSEDQ